MLLIGSQMLKKVRPDLLLREPRDWDWICTQAEFDKWVQEFSHCFDRHYEKKPGRWVTFLRGQIMEHEIARDGNTAEELHHLAPCFRPLDLLYFLKMSHRYLKNSPHFLKTMRYIRRLRDAGAELQHLDLFKRREKETYSYPHPKLNQKSSKFFDPNQGIKYIYDHDSIHIALARCPGKPAYTFFKDDQAEVKVSREKFFALPEEVRLNSVLEESYVLALERSQLPFPGVLTPRQSFLKALEKVCTSISSGWWREYAWENYDAAVTRYSGDYVRQFEEGVKSGIVKPFDGVVRHMETSK